MEPRVDTTLTPAASKKSESALQWLGIGTSHSLRALMRLHKDLAFELVGGDRVKVSLGAHLVPEDLTPYLPEGVILIPAKGEVVLARELPAGSEAASAGLTEGLTIDQGELKMPERPIIPDGEGSGDPTRSKVRAPKQATTLFARATSRVVGCEEKIREACEALGWRAGEREVLQGAVAQGVTIHLEVFERARGGSLELRNIDNVGHRDLLKRLGFRPTSSSAWCADWKKLPSERDASEQTATVALGSKPAVHISFE